MAVTLRVVNTVTDDELVRNRETNKLHRYLHFTAVWFIQQSTDGGFGSRRLRISRTLESVLPESMMFDDQHIFTNIFIQIFQDFHITGCGHAAAVAGGIIDE